MERWATTHKQSLDSHTAASCSTHTQPLTQPHNRKTRSTERSVSVCTLKPRDAQQTNWHPPQLHHDQPTGRHFDPKTCRIIRRCAWKCTNTRTHKFIDHTPRATKSKHSIQTEKRPPKQPTPRQILTINCSSTFL